MNNILERIENYLNEGYLPEDRSGRSVIEFCQRLTKILNSIAKE